MRKCAQRYCLPNNVAKPKVLCCALITAITWLIWQLKTVSQQMRCIWVRSGYKPCVLILFTNQHCTGSQQWIMTTLKHFTINDMKHEVFTSKTVSCRNIVRNFIWNESSEDAQPRIHIAIVVKSHIILYILNVSVFSKTFTLKDNL